jgi:hypothetical protein
VSRPALAGLVVADPPEVWEAIGFTVEGGICRVGPVAVRLAGPERGRGIVAWSLRDAGSTDLDGLDTAVADGPAEPGAAHPNGVTGLDHLVVLTPSLERTGAALERAGMPLRRIREAGTADRPVRQGFRRIGDAVLELVESPDLDADAPARFWGLVFVARDLEALAKRLGDRLGEARDAVQPGRRIATLRRSAGLGMPAAFMTPER